MPKIGEVRRARDVGYKAGKGSVKLTWAACLDCGKERWIRPHSGRSMPLRCRQCAGKAQGKGGYRRLDGYKMVHIPPDSFFRPMTHNDGYILEHRLIMAQHLGRCLQSWEKVHHKDGIRDHNDWRNLKMTTAGSHIKEHNKGYRDGYQQGLLDGRDKQIQELRQEIKLLQWQVKEFLISDRVVR